MNAYYAISKEFLETKRLKAFLAQTRLTIMARV